MIHSCGETPTKRWSKIESFWRSVGGQLQGRAIYELGGACTNVDDQVMIVRQCSRDSVKSWRGIFGVKLFK